jgi:hypothetical protein
VDEQVLEITPVLLYFTEVADNVVNQIEVLVPLLDFFLESGEVTGTKHSSDLCLVFLKHLKVFFVESGSVKLSVFVLLEIKFDNFPGFSQLLECFLHLSFLSGLIGNFFDVLSVLSQIHFVNVSEEERFIDLEF